MDEFIEVYLDDSSDTGTESESRREGLAGEVLGRVTLLKQRILYVFSMQGSCTSTRARVDEIAQH